MGHRKTIRIVTYNIHKCRGIDGRVRPERVVEVLREVDADVIALQEVLGVHDANPAHDQAEYIAARLGVSNSCFGENRKHGGAAYGNATMTRLSLASFCNYDISCARMERRGALRSDIQLSNGRVMHVYNVHLGTSFGERRLQAQRLLDEEILRNPGLDGPRVVLGDFNEWVQGLATRMLTHALTRARLKPLLGVHRRTYPGWMPFLHLDHIYHDRELRCIEFRAHRSRMAMVASDHLPLVAEFEL